MKKTKQYLLITLLFSIVSLLSYKTGLRQGTSRQIKEIRNVAIAASEFGWIARHQGKMLNETVFCIVELFEED